MFSSKVAGKEKATFIRTRFVPQINKLNFPSQLISVFIRNTHNEVRKKKVLANTVWVDAYKRGGQRMLRAIIIKKMQY